MFGVKVWRYLMGVFSQYISDCAGKDWGDGRTKALGCGQVHKDTFMIAQDMDVKGFVAH